MSLIEAFSKSISKALIAVLDFFPGWRTCRTAREVAPSETTAERVRRGTCCGYCEGVSAEAAPVCARPMERGTRRQSSFLQCAPSNWCAVCYDHFISIVWHAFNMPNCLISNHFNFLSDDVLKVWLLPEVWEDSWSEGAHREVFGSQLSFPSFGQESLHLRSDLKKL